MMFNKWKLIFYFPKSERRGISYLLLLCTLLYLLRFALPSFIFEKPTDFSTLETEIIAFQHSIEIDQSASSPQNAGWELPKKQVFANPNYASKEQLIAIGLSAKIASTIINYRNTGAKFYRKIDLKKIYGLNDSTYRKIEPFVRIDIFPKKQQKVKNKKPDGKIPENILKPFLFDPNQASKDTLLQLGLQPKIAQTIINFRTKGGTFRIKSDFKKIFGLTEKNYLALYPFIQLPEQQSDVKIEEIQSTKAFPLTNNSYDDTKIDINKADIETWVKLPGIGYTYAGKIVQYRDKLGGFYSIDQIKTTYGVPDSVIDKNYSLFEISPIRRQIPINSIKAEELKNHPYITSRQAHIIVNYRTNHGPFSKLDDLKKIHALKTDFLNKISPYLLFE